VVAVVGGTVVEGVVVAPAWVRLEVPRNAAEADVDGDVDVRDPCPEALAIWTSATAQMATSKIGTSPTARPRRARGERMSESSWVWNV
jgi:hypothetical protein